MKKTSLFLVLCMVISMLQAQISDVKLISSKVIQYSRADFSIALKGNWNNPYFQEEVALDMIVISPDGTELVQPAYYVSGNSGEVSNWTARFTPQQSGEYNYYFRLKEDDVVSNKSNKMQFNSTASDLKGFLHTKNNWVLEFDNGEPFRGVGENLCWESRANDDSKFFKDLHEKEKYNYDYLIPLFAKNGGNFCRVWMCSWNFPIDRQDNFNNDRYVSSDEYFNPSACQRLDDFIALCEKEDVYVMLCMEQGNVRADHDFFISEDAKTKYRNRLRYIVARWGYSPNIGMWEFFNEIDNIQYRNPGGPIPAEDIVVWHTAMSSYLKNLDPYNHIRTTSISHRDLEGLNSVPDIDINQKHIYKNTSGIPSEIEKYEKEFGKPYVIGEFGYEWDWSKNFDDFSEGMDYDFRRGLWYGLFTSTPITPMSWWWEYFENRGMMSYFRGVREISDKMLAAGNGSFQKVDVTAESLESYSVQCGNTIFVYLLNNSEKSVVSTVNIENVGEKKRSGRSFNPTTLKYESLKELDYVQDALWVEKVNVGPMDELVLILSVK